VATEDLAIELAKRPLISAPTFRKLLAKITRHVAKLDKIRRRRLARLFAPLDPDREVVRLEDGDVSPEHFAKTRKAIEDLLQLAAFTRLDDEEVKACIGVASAWGVNVMVDFAQLGHWSVHARGDVCGLRPKRDWRKLWRREVAEVPLYQRLVVMFEVGTEGKVLAEQLGSGYLHLRLFKNIPKPDVDMLLPTSAPRFSWMDRSKVIVPTVGKVGMGVYKIGRGLVILAFVGIYGTLAMLALVVAIIAQAARSFFIYLQQRDRLLLSMTRSLYYQKLDSGSGALWGIAQSAVEQEIEEGMVAAAVLLESDDPVDIAVLTERGAKMIYEICQIEVIFRARQAADLLVSSGVASWEVDGRLRLSDSSRQQLGGGRLHRGGGIELPAGHRLGDRDRFRE
jgi:hypothetical protein